MGLLLVYAFLLKRMQDGPDLTLFRTSCYAVDHLAPFRAHIYRLGKLTVFQLIVLKFGDLVFLVYDFEALSVVLRANDDKTVLVFLLYNLTLGVLNEVDVFRGGPFGFVGLNDLYKIGDLPFANESTGADNCEGTVVLGKHKLGRFDAGMFNLCDFSKRVRVKDMYPLFFDRKEVLTPFGVFNQSCVFDFKTLELAELVVQDVVDPDLVNK
jgi:hypothetical protein